jgi:uncharacterized protein YjgD (DUF1641 family)
MAQPVPYRVFTPPTSREELKRRIDDAPVEHAEAVLSAYKLLEQAHQSGTLDMVRGAMAAGDSIINHVVNLVSAPETVTALRNLMLLGKVLAKVDPESLNAALAGLNPDGSPRTQQNPPSIFSIVRKMNTRDARRGLGVAVDVLAAVGSGLAKEQTRE